MISFLTWYRYLHHKLKYSVSTIAKNYKRGQITTGEASDVIWKNFFRGRLTYLHWNTGEEMAPTIAGKEVTLLVRKLPTENLPTRVSVGDVVVVKDPEDQDNYLIRRLAATGGHEIASTDEKDEPFVLESDECWLLADDEKLKPKEANDSRIFGPIQMSDIVGRVLYCLQSAADHGPVQNSQGSMKMDSPVLQVELDVEEMRKFCPDKH